FGKPKLESGKSQQEFGKPKLEVGKPKPGFGKSQPAPGKSQLGAGKTQLLLFSSSEKLKNLPDCKERDVGSVIPVGPLERAGDSQVGPSLRGESPDAFLQPIQFGPCFSTRRINR